MNDSTDRFHDLAWRALERPDDVALRAEVEALCAAHAEFAVEWRQLQADYALLREAGAATAARRGNADEESIPDAQLEKLVRGVTASRAATPAWWARGLAAAAVLALAALLVTQTKPANSDDAPTRWLVHAPSSLSRAFSVPLATLLAEAQLPPLRSSSSLQVQSPLVAAVAGPVTVAWRAPDERPLTVTLHDSSREIWREHTTHPRVITPPLAADRVYELRWLRGEQTIARERFVTVALAESEAEKGIDAVFAAAIAEPARLGEAVLAWHALPRRVKRSEAAIRLGLWLGVTARQPDLLEEVRALAREMPVR